MDFAFEEEGILVISPPTDFNETETLEHAKENVEYGMTLVADQLRGILAYMPKHYVNAAATSYYKKNVPDVPVAMVAHSFFQRMIGNFMLSIESANRPVKLFATEEEARKWLKSRMEYSK